MNPNTAMLLFLPPLFVLTCDYILLKYYYRKPTSVDRILKFERGTRLDLTYWILYHVVAPKVGYILYWTTVPGLFALGLVEVARVYQITAPLSSIIPNDGWFVIPMWLICMDFARYATHVLLHKVPQLWYFHKVHHATTEFNVVTGNRVALGEKFANDIGSFVVVSLVLGIPTPEIAIGVLLTWNILNVFHHTDLPWDFGWLGYIFVSPRFHRMHHSGMLEDADANYGSMLSIWDYLFGTTATRYRDAPELADTCQLGLSCPLETSTINESWVRSSVHGTVATLGARVWGYCKNETNLPRLVRAMLRPAGGAVFLVASFVGLCLLWPTSGRNIADSARVVSSGQFCPADKSGTYDFDVALRPRHIDSYSAACTQGVFQIVLALSRPSDVSRLNLVEYGNGNYWNEFAVRLSTDGDNWVDVFDSRNPDAGLGAYTRRAGGQIALNLNVPRTSSYIQIEHRVSTGQNRMLLRKFEIIAAD